MALENRVQVFTLSEDIRFQNSIAAIGKSGTSIWGDVDVDGELLVWVETSGAGIIDTEAFGLDLSTGSTSHFTKDAHGGAEYFSYDVDDIFDRGKVTFSWIDNRAVQIQTDGENIIFDFFGHRKDTEYRSTGQHIGTHSNLF